MAEIQEIEMTMIVSRKVTENLKKALEQIQTIKQERERWCLNESRLFEKLINRLKSYLQYMQSFQEEIEQSKFSLKEHEKNTFKKVTVLAWEKLEAIVISINEHKNFLSNKKRKNRKILQQLELFITSVSAKQKN